MRSRWRILAVLSFGLVFAGMAALLLERKSQASDKEVTLTGTISDSMCGGKHMMSGDDAKCVRSCVKNGFAYVLLADNKVYTLKGKSEDLDRLAGQKASVTGNLSDASLAVTSVAPAHLSSAPAGQPSSDVGNTPPSTTIEGLVRDIACPIQNKDATATEFNLKCAQECAKLGSPLVILTKDGTLYTPISESMPDQDQRQRLMPFLGKFVRVNGPVYERNGTRAIAVKTIEELKDVRLKTNAE